MAKKMKSMEYIPREKNLEECVPCDTLHGPDFPSLYIDSKQVPEIDVWDVGEEYEMKILVKMKSYSISDDGDRRSRADLSVLSYERKAEKSLS